MLNVLVKICIALFLVSFIVTIHEFGHYLVGRLLGIKIREFSVGILGVKFLPKFVDSRKTIWRIGLLPIGGYVSFVEKENEKQDLETEIEEKQSNNFLDNLKNYFIDSPVFKAFTNIYNVIKYNANKVIDKTEYSNSQIKGAYFDEVSSLDKVILALAGPLANFVLTIVVFFFLYLFAGRSNNQLYFVDTPNRQVIEINGVKPINLIHFNHSKRDSGKINSVKFIEDGNILENGFIDLPKIGEKEISKIRYNPIDSLKFALSDTAIFMKINVYRLVNLFINLFQRNMKEAEKLSGIVGIVRSSLAEIDKGLYSVCKWVALISLSFGVLNLVIIPPFDGSIVLIGITEMIIGRKQKLQDIANEAAVIVILVFLFVTIRNDLFLKQKVKSEQNIEQVEEVK